jgi:hypothetical protein
LIVNAVYHENQKSFLHHQAYSLSHGHCYWCERSDLLGVDIFPFIKQKNQVSKATKNSLGNLKESSSNMTFSTYQDYLYWLDQVNHMAKPLSEDKFYASTRFNSDSSTIKMKS